MNAREHIGEIFKIAYPEEIGRGRISLGKIPEVLEYIQGLSADMKYHMSCRVVYYLEVYNLAPSCRGTTLHKMEQKKSPFTNVKVLRELRVLLI